MLAIALIFNAFTSCQEAPLPMQKLQGNYYTPLYAQGFCIDTLGGRKILTVCNPFQQGNGQKYTYLLDSLPIRRVVCMSTTHLGFLDFINKTDAVVGISGARYIFHPLLQTLCRQGKIADVGYEANLNVESLVSLQPNAVLAYGINGETKVLTQKLQELGIRLIYIGEYMEPHPLGKAEWAVAIAALFDAEQRAQQLFQVVVNQYVTLRDSVAKITTPSQVLLNAPWNDAWFMPGSESNMAQYLHDAGGLSAIALHAGRAAYPESIESVWAQSQQTEYWLNPGNACNLQELQQMHKLIAEFPVLAKGKVYNNNKRNSLQGGSDFFESGAVHPDWILADLIAILHPTILPEHCLYYYQKLQ
ncbi:iron ABC transporter substrate-binding protein [Bacteroidia bacterium]|nr:iron ABC transporter substrate-binding protein [Bacteroidia bacterium]